MARYNIKQQITVNRILFYWRISIIGFINNINLNIWSFKGETILTPCDGLNKVKNLFRRCFNHYSVIDRYLLDFSHIIGNHGFYRMLWKWKIYFLYARSHYWPIFEYFYFLLTKSHFLQNFKYYSCVECDDNYSDVFIYDIIPFNIYRPSNQPKKSPFSSVWCVHFC